MQVVVNIDSVIKVDTVLFTVEEGTYLQMTELKLNNNNDFGDATIFSIIIKPVSFTLQPQHFYVESKLLAYRASTLVKMDFRIHPNTQIILRTSSANTSAVLKGTLKPEWSRPDRSYIVVPEYG